MNYGFRVSPRAETQIRDAADWWIENRPKAPHAFAEELERAFEVISSLPGTGEPVLHSRLKGLRRLLMGRVRYYLYYQVDHERETVEVLSLWHASRGALRPPSRICDLGPIATRNTSTRRARRRHGSMTIPPVHIIVSRSSVIITGVVNNQLMKQKAGSIIRQTPGVLSVESRLRIGS